MRGRINKQVNQQDSNTLTEVLQQNRDLQSLLTNLQSSIQHQSVRNQEVQNEHIKEKEFLRETLQQERQNRLNHPNQSGESSINNMQQEYKNNYNGNYNRNSRDSSPRRPNNNGYRPHNSNNQDYNSHSRNNDNNNYQGRSQKWDDQRGRSRSPGPGYNNRSRSPSPTTEKCFACQGSHWKIRCPGLTREEKEVELLKIIEKNKRLNGGSISDNQEKGLYDKFQIEKTKVNQTLLHDKSKEPAGTTTGHYCKWCHARGHNMLICKYYCPICEQVGHGWQTCTKDTNLVQKRMGMFKNVMDRLSVYATS